MIEIERLQLREKSATYIAVTTPTSETNRLGCDVSQREHS
jgi:hypothetical protein